MRLKKEEWEMLTKIECILIKHKNVLNEREKDTLQQLHWNLIHSYEVEKAERKKMAERVAEKRKTNPNYARPQYEWIKNAGRNSKNKNKEVE